MGSRSSASFLARALPAATLATLLAGLLLSVLLAGVLYTAERARALYDFERRSQARFTAIARSVEDAADSLRAINLLLRSAAEVPDAQYDRFAQPLLASHRYLHALLFYRFVRDEARAAYEAQRRQAWPGFRIRERTANGFVPAARRPLYLTLDLAVPRNRHTLIQGYDIWAYAPHRALLDRTLDTGQLSASQLVRLIAAPERRGIVMALPVYPPGVEPRTAADRRAAAVGVTEVVIDVAALVQEKLAGAELLVRKGIGISLSGRERDGGALVEVARFGTSEPAEPAWLGRLVGAAVLERTQRIEVAGQEWSATARSRLPASTHAGSVLVLLTGIAFSIATATYVHARAGRAREVEQLVAVRTADLKRASEALRLHQRAIASSINSVIIADATKEGFPVEYVNPAFERLRGIPAHEAVGRTLAELVDDAPDQPGIHELRKALRERHEGNALLCLRRRDGSAFYCEAYLAPVNDELGNTEHFVIFEYDVTTAKQYEAELERRAHHDTLTGLPNRVLLADRIERTLAVNGQRRCCVWVVALDLDRFKHVNDSLGHAAGDRLLKQAGQRIAGALRPADTVARTGDDEFVLLLAGRDDEGQAMATVDAVLAAMAQPFSEDGRRIHLSCSAGVAAYPGDGEDADTLVRHAEIAMYRAKEAGRNTACFYLPGMNQRAHERLALVDAMREALPLGQFELHYQPQVKLDGGSDDGRIVGAEALIRWRHPRMGLMRPDRFIGLAEDTGLIVPIGAWALRQACEQAAAWRRAGFPALRVGVNLSSRQFKERSLAAAIGEVLADTGLPPACLELELTETVVMEDMERAIDLMRELKAMGVRLAIDDFGTGYSSLSYLKRFPADVLKVDQSFVRDIEHEAGSAAMVAAIVSLSHDLGLQVIAEGVETPAQCDFLRARRCDEVQGYLFGRPVPAAEFEKLLLAQGAPRT